MGPSNGVKLISKLIVNVHNQPCVLLDHYLNYIKRSAMKNLEGSPKI